MLSSLPSTTTRLPISLSIELSSLSGRPGTHLAPQQSPIQAKCGIQDCRAMNQYLRNTPDTPVTPKPRVSVEESSWLGVQECRTDAYVDRTLVAHATSGCRATKTPVGIETIMSSPRAVNRTRSLRIDDLLNGVPAAEEVRGLNHMGARCSPVCSSVYSDQGSDYPHEGDSSRSPTPALSSRPSFVIPPLPVPQPPPNPFVPNKGGVRPDVDPAHLAHYTHVSITGGCKRGLDSPGLDARAQKRLRQEDGSDVDEEESDDEDESVCDSVACNSFNPQFDPYELARRLQEVIDEELEFQDDEGGYPSSTFPVPEITQHGGATHSLGPAHTRPPLASVLPDMARQLAGIFGSYDQDLAYLGPFGGPHLTANNRAKSAPATYNTVSDQNGGDRYQF